MEKKQDQKRILGRLKARELSAEELQRVAGGLAVATTSCSNCQADDCDELAL